jgi:hypothetical protein
MLCRYAECPYVKCRTLFIVTLNVIMLSVVMLCVVLRGSPAKLFTAVIVEQGHIPIFFDVLATLVSGEHSSLLRKSQQCWTVLIF